MVAIAWTCPGDENETCVFGDRAAEVNGLVQAMLPWAVVAPYEVLRRLLLDCALHPQQVAQHGA
jgi:hypothetical protein